MQINADGVQNTTPGPECRQAPRSTVRYVLSGTLGGLPNSPIQHDGDSGSVPKRNGLALERTGESERERRTAYRF